MGKGLIGRLLVGLTVLAPLVAGVPSRAATGYDFSFVGDPADAAGTPLGGVALMGGGEDQDAAFAWMAERADGGDFLVLRASGGDAYNDYIASLDPSLDSVATLVIRNRAAASHPKVIAEIYGAEAIFIAGGDQARYLALWEGTPLQTALRARIDAGAVVGGTSAGAMVLSGHVYSAADGTVTSRQALRNPFDRRVTLADRFVDLPLLEDALVDTHFGERNREGRLLAFLARLSPEPVRGVGIDEATALLIEPSGEATVVGDGEALVIDPDGGPQRLRKRKPLGWRDVPAERVGTGEGLDLRTWAGDGEDVLLTARRGRLREEPAP